MQARDVVLEAKNVGPYLRIGGALNAKLHQALGSHWQADDDNLGRAHLVVSLEVYQLKPSEDHPEVWGMIQVKVVNASATPQRTYFEVIEIISVDDKLMYTGLGLPIDALVDSPEIAGTLAAEHILTWIRGQKSRRLTRQPITALEVSLT